MKTGFLGTFVIAWGQTELDGIRAAPPQALRVGSTWRWTGEPVRVDGPRDILVLGDAEGQADLHRRAARMVRRLMGGALGRRILATDPDDDAADDAPAQGFVVTDGRDSYRITLVDLPETRSALLMCLDCLPPRDTDLWVAEQTAEAMAPRRNLAPEAVICFTPGTRIASSAGPRLIEDLRPGDRIDTRDDGAQEILWIGRRRMSGARLHALPGLRPIRIRAGALGEGRPDGDLLVSPQHRLLVSGGAARALFNEDEVLVAAEDLVNDRSIHVDHAVREVEYIHILLARHQIVWANGVETESFHPANTALGMIEAGQRAALLALMPGLEADPMAYGGFARRNLARSETAILRYAQQ